MRIFGNRVERNRGKWALWRWHDIVLDGKQYLTRLQIFKTPWLSAKLHWIHLPDPDRDLHTHPWYFISLVLSGSYQEIHSKTPDQDLGSKRSVRWFNFYRPNWGHRISSVAPGTLTFILTGPKASDDSWGFYDAKTLQYIPWQQYEDDKFSSKKL